VVGAERKRALYPGGRPTPKAKAIHQRFVGKFQGFGEREPLNVLTLARWWSGFNVR